MRCILRVVHLTRLSPIALFMLGIVASSLDDLTPCDVGKLLRYARINTPAIVTALAGPLTELLAVGKNRR